MKQRSLNYVLLLAGMIAVVTGFSLWGQPAYDPDLGWHLFGGKFIVDHQEVPRADLINTFSTRWHDYHWLGQILLYRIFQLGGYQGLSIALGAAGALFCLILAAIAERQGILRRSPILVTIAICTALFLIREVMSVRPQVLSLLILSVVLLILKGRERWTELPLIFGLTVIAANVHVYWLFIPLLYSIYRLLPPAVAASRSGFYLHGAGFMLLLSAALISPYGLFHDSSGWTFENYALIYDYLLMPEALRLSIGELKGALSSDGMAPLLLVVLIAVSVRGFRRTDVKTQLPDLVAALIGLVLALRAMKFLAVFALFAFPYLLVCLFRVSRPLRKARFSPRSPLSQGVLVTLLLAAVIRTVLLFPDARAVNQQLHDYLPVAACSRIAELPLSASYGRDHVRVMTHFNYGGWCRWIMFQQAPEKDFRVTIDGRTQWFPPTFFTRALDLYNARHDWLATMRDWAPDVVLVPRDKPLANVLALARADWKLEYEDPSFAVFVPIRKD